MAWTGSSGQWAQSPLAGSQPSSKELYFPGISSYLVPLLRGSWLVTNLRGNQNLFTKARCQHNSNQGQRRQGRYEETLEKPQFTSNFWQPGHCLCPDNQALMKKTSYSLGLRIHWTTFLCWIISPNSSARIPWVEAPRVATFSPIPLSPLLISLSDKNKFSLKNNLNPLLHWERHLVSPSALS